MKITLILDHEMDGVVHKAGETIEVSEDVYAYLQKAYQELREAPIRAQKAKEAEEQLEKMMNKHGRSRK